MIQYYRAPMTGEPRATCDQCGHLWAYWEDETDLTHDCPVRQCCGKSDVCADWCADPVCPSCNPDMEDMWGLEADEIPLADRRPCARCRKIDY